MNIEGLLQDEVFAKEVENAGSLEEIAKLLNAKGIVISTDELQKAMDFAESGELSEDSLEDVAGGMLIPVPIIITRWIINRLRRK